MFVIPLGPEDREVRRIPWITVALLAANLLVHILVSFSPWSQQATTRAERSYREFFEYWMEHPHLKLPDEYARYVGSARAEREQKLLKKALAVLSARGYRQGSWAQGDQSEFDAHAVELVKAMKDTPAYALGFVPAHKTALSFLTHMFTHGGWFHLLGNMIFLLMTAPFLEDRYGRLLFPAFYLAAGVASVLAYAAKAPDSLVPLVGASGAIAGVLGAFAVRLGRTRMVYFVMPLPIFFFFHFRVRIPAWFVFGIWFLEQLAYNALVPDAGVAWSAHIGGFLFGIAFAFGMKLASVEERWIHPAIEKEIGWQQHPALTRAAELRDARDFEGARQQLRIGLAAEPNNVDAWRALFDLSVDERDDAEAARAATRRIELLAGKGEAELAVLAVAETLDHVNAEFLPARFWVAAAGARERTGDARSAYDCWEAMVVRFPHDALAARALMKMAEILAKAGDPATAWRLVRLAQDHPGCQAGWREAADRILASLPPASAPSKLGEPIPIRGSYVPRGTKALPGASVFAAAFAGVPAPPPSPVRRIEREAPRAAEDAAEGAPPPIAPGGQVSGTPGAPVPIAPASKGGFFVSSSSAPRRAMGPALAWSLGGLAAAAIGGAALFVWEPWAKSTSDARASVQTPSPIQPAASATSPPAAASVPASAAPAPASATAAAAPGSEVPLRVTFKSPFAAGQVIVQANGRTVLTKSYDFGKESGGGVLDEVVVVSSGSADVRVWVTSQDRTVRAYATLEAMIPADEPKALELSLAGEKLALALK